MGEGAGARREDRIQNTGDRRREPEGGGRKAAWAEGHPTESKGINHKFHELTRRRERLSRGTGDSAAGPPQADDCGHQDIRRWGAGRSGNTGDRRQEAGGGRGMRDSRYSIVDSGRAFGRRIGIAGLRRAISAIFSLQSRI